jgi:hypothetical protein
VNKGEVGAARTGAIAPVLFFRSLRVEAALRREKGSCSGAQNKVLRTGHVHVHRHQRAQLFDRLPLLPLRNSDESASA